MKTSCCYKCENRTQFCHITCAEYEEEKERERVSRNKERKQKLKCYDFTELKKERNKKIRRRK